MKNKTVISVIAVLAVVLVVIFIKHSFTHGKATKKTVSAAKAGKSRSEILTKKVFSKGMGGLTVKVKGSNGKSQNLRIRAFNVDSKNSSVFVAAFSTERMQELLPGTYDLEIETIPNKIYKNVSVGKGEETVQDLGAVTGSINIKALNSKKKEAFVIAKIVYPKSNLIVTAVTTNRPVEIVPGVYNIELETLPRQIKNDVKIEGGKDTVLDLGVVSGSVVVKAVGEDGKEAHVNVRIKNPINNTIVVSTVANRAVEIVPGEYEIDILSTPIQTKKGVKIVAGEETALEVSVQNAPQQPAQKTPAPAAKRK